MNATQKQEWERTRAKGHTRYILLTCLRWGLPMWAIQTFGPLLYDVLMHRPYDAPPQWSSVAAFIFDLALWVFGYGYAMGESFWQLYEKRYKK